jgi:DedD protein
LDSLVKERLTGAIILVVLIVLLVPELLSGPSRSVPAPQAAATSSEETPLRSYTIDLAEESHAAAASASGSNVLPQSSGPAQPTPIVEPPAAQQANASSSKEGSPEQTQDSPQPAPAAATGSQETSREQPQPSPTHPQGASPSYERSPTASPPTGPHAAHDKPATAERAGVGAKPTATGEWMVQLGVFRNHTNAERLAQQLKEQGFHTLVSESLIGGGPLWRVRAGPVAERASAEQLGARLRAAGHAGSVVPK